jgi:hypothetical protein
VGSAGARLPEERKTVKKWCTENGISVWTYNVRLRRVREAAITEEKRITNLEKLVYGQKSEKTEAVHRHRD